MLNRIRQKDKLVYPNQESSSILNPLFPDVRFAVISDLHYYNLSLGVSGAAFEKNLHQDRKLLKESADLIDLAVNHIAKSEAEFVLIPGDLTKDGEKIGHLELVKLLEKLRTAGKDVYVIPGNHDLNMYFGARKFVGDRSESAEALAASEFADLYHNYGYDQAIERDDHSLSYVAELKENLWLFSIDTCSYKGNTSSFDYVGSKISQNQVDWLARMLQKAAEERKAVMAMIHHGVVEHWIGQSILHSDYLVEDYRKFSRFLASYGVRLVFTGHYHAQDIARADFEEGAFIYDIETGSLITPPCPLRLCKIKDNRIEIESKTILESYRPGSGFAEVAFTFLQKTFELEIISALKKYRISDQDAALIGRHLASAFIAHSLGDEKSENRPVLKENDLGLWARFVYKRLSKYLDALWHNEGPADLNVVLNLGKD